MSVPSCGDFAERFSTHMASWMASTAPFIVHLALIMAEDLQIWSLDG